MNNDTKNAALSTWIDGLNDDDHSVRRAAAMALGTAGEQEAADALVSCLGTESDCFVREALTWATVQAGAPAVPGVLALLSSPTPAVRMQAAHVLSKIGDPAHAPQLLGVVADEDPEVAVKAFRAAANTGQPEVVPALAARLGDGDLEQRDALTAAFAILAEVGVEALVEALADPDTSVREHAADTLGHLGSPAADAAAERLQVLLSDPEASVRLSAVSALGQLDAEVGAAGLATAAQSTDLAVQAVAKRLLNR